MIKGTGIVVSKDGYISVQFFPEDAEVVEVTRELIENWVSALNLLKDIQTELTNKHPVFYKEIVGEDDQTK